MNICASSTNQNYSASDGFGKYGETSTLKSFLILLVTGLDIWASLLSTGIICTFYTTIVSILGVLRKLLPTRILARNLHHILRDPFHQASILKMS